MARRVPRRERLARYAKRLLHWHVENRRHFLWREDLSDKYTLILVEILLQQTSAARVDALLPSLLGRYSGWCVLAGAEVSELEAALRPLGLWRRRARVLSSLAREVCARGEQFPKDRAEIESLPGVGQYVANAIELFCHGKERPLLDGTMARALERYFGPRELVDIRHDPYLQTLASKLVAQSDPVQLNWAILDLGALVCKTRIPLCAECPLARGCKHHEERH